MPERVRIHSSDVSMIFARASLVTTLPGTPMPDPMMTERIQKSTSLPCRVPSGFVNSCMRVSTIVFSGLLAIPVAVSGQCPNGTPPPCTRVVSRPAVPPANVRARQIVLLPFRNVTRAPANDWLVTGAPLILGEILAQYRDLRVVPEPSLTAARRRLGISSDVVPDQSQRRRLAEETGGW